MRTIKLILLILLLSGSYTYAQKSEIFAPEGIAIKGFDPVAFFKESKAVPGADSLSYRYKDADWHFASQSNLDTFKMSPEKYAPQYGGYCAFGASKGYKAPTETETWTIAGDKLYFNYNMKVKKTWSNNQEELIEKADNHWQNIKDKP